MTGDDTMHAPRADGGTQRFTSQLYFDDAFIDRVHAAAPYAGRGTRRWRNRDDPIWRDGGSLLMLAPERTGEGYDVRFDVGLSAT
jgi:hypothetical protein